MLIQFSSMTEDVANLIKYEIKVTLSMKPIFIIHYKGILKGVVDCDFTFLTLVSV